MEHYDLKGRILYKGETQAKTGAYKGRYEYTYYDAFGNRKHVYSWRLTAADRVPNGKADCRPLRELEKEIQKELSIGFNRSNGATVDKLWNDYISICTNLKPNTISDYRRHYRLYIAPVFGKRKINEIRYTDVEKHLISLCEAGKGERVVCLTAWLFGALFDRARRDQILIYNPCSDALKEVRKRYKWDKKTRDALTKEESERLFDFLKGSNCYCKYYDLFSIMVDTGMREGELCGLKWSDIDFRNHLITIDRGMVYYKDEVTGKCKKHTQTPKTKKSARIIPMTERVYESFLRLEKRSHYRKNSEYVFLNRNDEPNTPKEINRILQRIVEACNKAAGLDDIQIRHITPHSLRHTFTTRLYESGVDAVTMRDLVGHSDINMTLGVYTHISDQRKIEAIKTLDSMNE